MEGYNKIEKRIIIGFDDIFYDEQKKPLNQYLLGISQDLVLQTGVHFLNFQTNSQSLNNQTFIDKFFSPENYPFAYFINRRIKNFTQQVPTGTILLHPLTCFQLFEFAYTNLSSDQEQNMKEIEQNVFKAILLLNQINIDKEEQIDISTKELPFEIKFAAMAFTQTFAYNDLIITNEVVATDVFASQVMKLFFLTEYLSSNTYTSSLSEGFLEYFDCKNWNEYRKRIISLTHGSLTKGKDNYINLDVLKDKDFEKNCSFIEKISLEKDELSNVKTEDYDFILLRNKPIYKRNEGQYRVIYRLFLFEKLFKSMIFLLEKINKSQPSTIKIKDLRGIYCHKFSEKFLFYRTLKSYFYKYQVNLTGDEIFNQGVKAGGPDYYVRDNNNVLLFESKDILVKADVKSSYDFTRIESELKNKLFFDSEDNSNKAVLQLLNSIKRIISDHSLPFDNDLNTDNLVIYPILVIHDRLFNNIGFNYLVNYWFYKELEKEGQDLNKIKPIVVIDIDSLLIFQDFFISGKIDFIEIIEEYIIFTQMFNHSIRSEDQLIPYSLFLTNYLAGKKVTGRYPQIFVDLFDQLN